MKRIGLIGFFNYGLKDIGGGVMKTRNYEVMLKNKYGNDNVLCLDRLEGQMNPIKYVLHFIQIITTCSSILLFPTAKMLQTFLPLLLMGKRIFKYKLVYVVIGGWLPELLNSNSKLKEKLKHFDAIYLETQEMINEIDGLTNVSCIPNFSMRKPLIKAKEYRLSQDTPFMYCTYSRITKEKGIPDAISAISKINKVAGKVVCKLDIYGQVWPDYEQEFYRLVNENKSFVRYAGVLNMDDAISTLADYYALLFPTHYPGEGFPGTLVESFMSGLPVIASNWRYNSEIIKKGITGFVYNLDENDALKEAIEYTMQEKEQLLKMRENCIIEAQLYSPERVILDLYKVIEK